MEYELEMGLLYLLWREREVRQHNSDLGSKQCWVQARGHPGPEQCSLSMLLLATETIIAKATVCLPLLTRSLHK